MLSSWLYISMALVVPSIFAAPAAPAAPPPSSISLKPTTSSVIQPAITIGPLVFPIPLQSIITSILGPSPSPATKTTAEVSAATQLLTQAPLTITISTAVTTITEIVTIPSLPPATPTLPVPSSKTSWAAPTQMSDLSAFNVSAFPGGQRNLHIINGIPAKASATVPAINAQSTNPMDIVAKSLTTWDNSSSVLQLLYPENSINPASKPQGGAEFYATPLSLRTANSVSLEYSVFFPVDYDWVKGGKLPGLYGGHTGCSGGNNALTCFSTRLMWRGEGMGELYLYAPKAKQTDALCSDPQSVCDATYGFSIGRGSFQYAAGRWTHVRQTVLLNTPGKQDGGFTLDVNGRRVIDRADVYYRDVPSPSGSAKTKPKPKPTGILGPLLGGLIKGTDILLEDDVEQLFPVRPEESPEHLVFTSAKSSPNVQPQMTTLTTTSTASVAANTAPITTTSAVLLEMPQLKTPRVSVLSDPAPNLVGFTGIFFSTFFGGHNSQYATPKDQYTWFKDFAMTAH